MQRYYGTIHSNIALDGAGLLWDLSGAIGHGMFNGHPAIAYIGKPTSSSCFFTQWKDMPQAALQRILYRLTYTCSLSVCIESAFRVPGVEAVRGGQWAQHEDCLVKRSRACICKTFCPLSVVSGISPASTVFIELGGALLKEH